MWGGLSRNDPMPWSITLGRIAGTAVRIHITFILFLVWIGASALRHDGGGAALRNVLFIMLLFGCVLLHEFGHILTARRFGIATPEVTLLLIGGVASLERIPEKPGQELAVALAGPAVNIVIALALILVAGAVIPDEMQKIDDPRISLVARLAGANLFLAIFNLIPAFPMDGGRVLHALLSMKIGPQKATQMAARIGQGFAFVLGFAGLFGNPMLLFIAIFVYVAAAGEAQDSALRSAVTGLRVMDAMETRVATIGLEASLGEAVDLLLATPQREFPVLDGHCKPAGLLVREDLIAALAMRPREAPLSEIMRAPAPTVPLGQDLGEALALLGAGGAPALCVVDGEGALAGLLTRETMAEMMMIKSAQPDWTFKRRW